MVLRVCFQMSFMREFICYQEPMGPSFDLALTLLGWAWIRDSRLLRVWWNYLSTPIFFSLNLVIYISKLWKTSSSHCWGRCFIIVILVLTLLNDILTAVVVIVKLVFNLITMINAFVRDIKVGIVFRKWIVGGIWIWNWKRFRWWGWLKTKKRKSKYIYLLR